MKIGDKVRVLNDVGGGEVVGFQGRDIAVVRDADGFDIPTLVKECVVVSTDSYNIARPQPAEKNDAPSVPVRQLLHPVEEEEDNRPITFRPKPLERRGADMLNAMLAFVPVNVKEISDTAFEMYFVNDSNYNLRFALFAHGEKACVLRHEGEVEANTKLFLEEFRRDVLPEMERLTLQAIAFKPSKPFQGKAPLNVGLRVDGTRFYKLHTFRETDFFEEPALLLDIVRDDRPVRSVYVEAGELQEVLVSPKPADRPVRQPARKAQDNDSSRPVEIDLHAHELLETTAGLQPADILEFQLKTLRETLDRYKKERGRQLVFIHGKGEGVLRQAIIRELKLHYRQCRWQDASFREYGFGATMVIM